MKSRLPFVEIPMFLHIPQLIAVGKSYRLALPRILGNEQLPQTGDFVEGGLRRCAIINRIEQVYESHNRARDPAEKPEPRPVGGGAPQYYSDIVERFDRGKRGRQYQIDCNRSRSANCRDILRRGRGCWSNHSVGAHLVRNCSQIARRKSGSASCRRWPDGGERRSRKV